MTDAAVTSREPKNGSPVVLLVASSLVLDGVAPSDGAAAVVKRLAEVSAGAGGLFVFPACRSPQDGQGADFVTRHTRNHLAGTASHMAALVIGDGLAGSSIEDLIVSDFRTKSDEVTESFDIERLVAHAFAGFYAIAVPSLGAGLFSPGPQIVALCLLLFVDLHVLVPKHCGADAPISSLGDQLALAAELELPTTPFGSALEHGVCVRQMCVEISSR